MEAIKVVPAAVSQVQVHVDPEQIERWVEQSRSPTGFRDAELQIAAVCRAEADRITEQVLRRVASAPDFQAEATLATRQNLRGSRAKSGGPRTVEVMLLGGSRIRLRTPYYKPSQAKLSPRQQSRKKPHRGEGGAGLYPVLTALGIAFGVTPAVAGEVVRQITDSDSIDAGRTALARWGLNLTHPRARALVNHFSHRSLEQRSAALEAARQQPRQAGPLKGKRVVIATDGGRLRLRKTKPGRRRQSGHHGYDAPWVEPKLLVIYVVNAEGQREATFTPVLDGTLGDADALASMALGYLKALGAQEAAQLIVLGDGAEWIWNRAREWVAALGLAPERVREIVDWGHAAKMLYTIADEQPEWKDLTRGQWVKKAKALLHAGRIEALVEWIERLAVGRDAEALPKHVAYFQHNAHRLQYAAARRDKVPIGSGAVESAVRRVVNLRLKSNGIFWHELNAEGLLMLRAYLKAGRFEELIRNTLRLASPLHSEKCSPTAGLASLRPAA
jgi:hypothetical protein